MTIAADDGVMPQTREHAAVLQALGVDDRRGRRDQGRPRPIPSWRCSRPPSSFQGPRRSPSRPGRAPAWTSCAPRSIGPQAPSLRRADSDEAARLHIDRVFTIRGRRHRRHGHAVVGRDQRGATELTVLPSKTAGARPGRPGPRCSRSSGAAAGPARRRQPHRAGGRRHRPRRRARGGRRRRCARPTWSTPSSSSTQSSSLTPATRVQIHHGTREAPARLTWLGRALLADPPRAATRPAAGDRLVVRRDRAARHARGRPRARPGPRASTARAATCSPGSSAWLAAKRRRNRPDGQLDPAHPPPPPHGRRAKRARRPLSTLGARAIEERLR